MKAFLYASGDDFDVVLEEIFLMLGKQIDDKKIYFIGL